ncbi:DUF4097 family beta strand repeat-containing protein [Agromyces lapidis]|uniref:DUF4097 domain-containing protein n=1 Tax=Agromyces lapidis TaxID=279574 RepID=A0ABV5STK4_9MICO|nr:DUF4097 family beta strand repeat-containing protein [Agromyces lapidis]
MTRMTRTGRAIAIVAVASAATIAMSGCAWLAPIERFSDDATLDEQVQSIEIDHPEGRVTIEGVEGATSVSVSRTVSYRGAREIGATVEVQGDVLVLGGCGRNCSVDYTVEVPVGLDVSGATSNGAITLTGVNEVEVETSNGRIELDDVTGEIEAKTSNGRIEGRGLAGDGVSASTSNGAIELSLAAPQSVEAHTSNGSIDVAVPAGEASYRVETDTSNGSVDVDIDDLADGEFLLDLSTSNGSITVSGG